MIQAPSGRLGQRVALAAVDDQRSRVTNLLPESSSDSRRARALS